MTHRELKQSIIRLGDTITRLVKERRPHLKKRLRLHRLYTRAIRRRDAKRMAKYDEQICQLHRYVLEPLNEKIARREAQIRTYQRLMTGN